MLATDSRGFWYENEGGGKLKGAEGYVDPADDCWGKSVMNEIDPKEVAKLSEDAEYLGSIPVSFVGPSRNTPQELLREKKLRDYNLFMMNHPWHRTADDMEDENKRAYDSAYKENPQHIADKRNFEEAEARVANANSILKAVMTDPGLGLLDFEVEDKDYVNTLQQSNQHYIASRDKFFVPPRLGQQQLDPKVLQGAIVDAYGNVMTRQQIEEFAPLTSQEL